MPFQKKTQQARNVKHGLYSKDPKEKPRSAKKRFNAVYRGEADIADQQQLPVEVVYQPLLKYC